MNEDNIKAVRNLIATGLKDSQFRMDDVGVPRMLRKHDCNSAGCIAGWTVALLGPKEASFPLNGWALQQAQEYLELDNTQAEALFCSSITCDVLVPLTRRHAVHALNSLLETGMPEWPEPVMLELDDQRR